MANSELAVTIKLSMQGAGASQAASQLLAVAKAAGATSVSLNAMDGAAQKADSAFSGFLKASLVMAGLRTAVNAVEGAMSSLASIGAQAFEAVKNFETMNVSLRQLTATQLIQAGVTNNMATALQLAARPAADLIKWIEQLAIRSPFDSATIANVVQIAEGFQFAQVEAQRLTKDIVDLASARGRTDLPFITNLTDAFGQINTRGKVSLEQLNRIMEAGVPALSILGKAFGTTASQMSDMISKGAVPAREALEALMQWIETNMAGAADRMTNTWAGLTSSMQDIKNQDLRAVFSGIFDAIQPEAARVVSFLSSDEFKGRLQEIGKALGEGTLASIEVIKTVVTNLAAGGGPLAGLKSLFTGAIDSDAIKTAMVDVTVSIMLAANSLYVFMKQFEIMASAVISYIGNIKRKWEEMAGSFTNAPMFKAMEGANKAGQESRKWLEEISKLPSIAESTGMVPPKTATTATTVETAAQRDYAKEMRDLRESQEKLRQQIEKWGAQIKAPIATVTRPGSETPGAGLFAWPTPAEIAAQKALSTPTAPTGAVDTISEAMKKAARAIESAFDSLAKSIENKITDAINNAKKLYDVTGKKPGGPGIWEPGGGGPFENVYRALDIAKNAGRPDAPGYWTGGKQNTNEGGKYTPPAQTQQWMTTGPTAGMSQQGALTAGKAFEMGDLFAPALKGLIDWTEAGKLWAQEFRGGQIAKYASEAAAALIAKGGPEAVTSDAMEKMVTELAASDKDQLVPNLQSIRDAVKTLGGDSTLKDVVKALDTLDLNSKGTAGGVNVTVNMGAGSVQVQGGTDKAALTAGVNKAINDTFTFMAQALQRSPSTAAAGLAGNP